MADRRVFALFLFFVVASVAGKDYNDEDFCKYKCSPGVHNIACNFTSKCPSQYYNYRDVEITDELIKDFVNAHNDVRRKTVLGKTELKDGMSPKGSNMLKVKWNPELAYIASKTVKNCMMLHDCRQTETYNGQNLVTVWYTKELKPTDIKADVTWSVNYMASESKVTPTSQLAKFTDVKYEGKSIGHFTQVIWAKTPSIGCAMSLYDEDKEVNGKIQKRYRELICCNYVYGNAKDESVYKFGEPCSACPDHCEDNLCLELP